MKSMHVKICWQTEIHLLVYSTRYELACPLFRKQDKCGA